MIPPCRNRARWWLTAGWLMLNWPHSPPTWRSPSESKLITWSRVGSLTCLSRIAARCMVFARSRVSFVTLAVFLILRIAVVIGIGLQKSLTGWRQGDTSPSLPGGRWDQRVSEMGERRSHRSSTPGDSASRRHSLSDRLSLDIYHAIVIV